MPKGAKEVSKDIKTFTENLSEVTKSLAGISQAGDLSNLDTVLSQVQTAMSKIPAISEAINGVDLEKGSNKNASTLASLVESVKSIAKSFADIAGVGDLSGLGDVLANMESNIDKIKSVISGIANIELPKGASGKVSSMSEIVNNLKTIADTLVTLPEVPDVTEKIQSIKNALSKIKDLQTALDGGKANKGNSFSLEGMIMQAQLVTLLVNAINAIPVVAEGLDGKVEQIKNAINKLFSIGSELGGDGKGGGVAQGANTLNSLLQQVISILGQLQALNVQFQSTGTSYAQSLVNGFTGGDLERIPAKMNKIKDRLNSMSDLSSIGRRMSDTLVNGFNPNGIISKINSIQNAINSLKGKTVTININEVTTKLTVRRVNGVIIPEYHSTGGRVGSRLFKKRGTDTVPAMLTPGEYVLKRSVSNALGKGFLDALNGLNLSSAMAQLQNKVGGNVTNNTYNNITQNVDNKASYLNGLGSIRRVVRS